MGPVGVRPPYVDFLVKNYNLGILLYIQRPCFWGLGNRIASYVRGPAFRTVGGQRRECVTTGRPGPDHNTPGSSYPDWGNYVVGDQNSLLSSQIKNPKSKHAPIVRFLDKGYPHC